MRVITIALLSFGIAAPSLAADTQPPAKSPSEMTHSEIKAHNASVNPDDPTYIKCRKTEVIGSLARKVRVCRTNEQWKLATANGNQDTRDMVEGFARSGGSNNN